eukprot:3163945-Pyramimonas_sp.AAC.2
MGEDGFDCQTCALAAHYLSALQPGTVEVLGVLPEDVASMKEIVVYEWWRDFKAWPLQGDERTKCPIPLRGCACLMTLA